MKVLVIGSAGMLGHMTSMYLRGTGHKVTDISRSRRLDKNTMLLDVAKQSALRFEFINSFDAVINCAAMLVAASERNKPDAVLINAWFPLMLEKELARSRTKIVHVSTDGVFLGNDAPYQENALVDSGTFYGKAKALGEINNDKDLTVRASFVGPDMNESGMGLFNWFVKQQSEVTGYSNVLFNAVTNLEFAKFVAFALENDISGLYHLGASESISKAHFLEKVKECFGLSYLSIRNDGSKSSDNALANTRNDVSYAQKSYDRMLSELKLWMHENKRAYPHYTFL